MKKLVISLIVCAALGMSTDTTGTWTGKVDVGNPGSDPTIPMSLILKQNGSELTGTAGDASRQFPIEKVEIKGDAITFQVTLGPAVIIFALRQEGDVMTGTAKFQHGAMVHEGAVSFRRE